MEEALNLDSNLKSIYEHPIEFFYNENKLLKTQTANLATEIRLTKEENFRLNQNLFAKEGELRICNTTLEKLQQTFSELNSNIASLYKENSEIRNELLKSIEEKNLISNQRDSLKRENEIFILEIQKAQNDVINKIKEIQNFQNRIDQLNSEKINLSSSLFTAKNEITQEKFSSERLIIELNQIRNEILNKEKSFALEKQNFNLSITNMNDLIKESRENIITITKKSEGDIFKISKEKENLCLENERLILKIEENEMNLELKSKKIEELSGIIIELKRHIKQSEGEGNIIKEILLDKENEIANLYKIKMKYDNYVAIEKRIERENELPLKDSAFLKEDYKKLSAITKKLQKDFDLAKALVEKYQSELNELKEIKLVYEKTAKEYENLSSKYSDIKQSQETNEKVIEENKNEINVLNEFVDKLSKQNRELLYEIRMNDSRNTLLSKNLSREKYEDFIYSNINDLEPRLSELIKKNINLNLELNTMKENLTQFESFMKEKEEIIKNLEGYIKTLEDDNTKLKNEYDTFRYYSNSHYHLFSLNFAHDENSHLANLEETKTNLQKLSVNYQSVLKEKEKITEDFIKLHKNFSDLSQNNFELKNSLHNKDIDINRLQMENSNKSQILKNQDSIVELKENEINILKSELNQLKNFSSQNVKEKEEIIKNLSLNLNQTNAKLNETDIYFRSQMEKLFNENLSLKMIYEEFTKSLITSQGDQQMINLVQLSSSKHEIESSSLQTSNDELIRNFEIIKSKLISKNEENFKLKEEKCELQIKLENILTENSSLKYKNEFLDRRIKYFRNLLATREKRNPTFRERVWKVTEISMNEPEKFKEYSINVNEEEIPEMPNAQENVENFDEILSKKYLDAINKIQELNSENLLLQNKLNEINEISLNLVKNDTNAPYVYLFKKIEEMSNQNVKLENEKNLLQEEILKINKSYAFINLESEKIKKNEDNLRVFNRELSEKLQILEKTVEEQMKHSVLYSQSQLLINEKTSMINSLVDAKEDLNKKILFLEENLSEKNQMIQNLENQLKEHEENKEKELKNLADLHNREISQSKSNIFKNFYLCFKRSKHLIETFCKLRETLEEKIERLENSDRQVDQTKDFKEFNNILNSNEIQINELKKKIKDMESSHGDIVNNLNTEIESLRAKEKSLINEIKTFKNINQFEGSVDLKNYFGKLLRNMHSSTNIINYQNEKIKELESQIGKLKENLKSFEQGMSQAGNQVACEKCKILFMEVKTLTEYNNKLSQKISLESNFYINYQLGNTNKEIQKNFTKCQIEKEILMQDVQKISQYVKEQHENISFKNENPSLVNNLPQSQVEKNKTFSHLINQMRKASKIISLLEKSTNELKEEGLRLLQKDK